MRAEKIGLRDFLFAQRVPGVTSSRCQCGERRQTVAYILLHCWMLKDLRNQVNIKLCTKSARMVELHILASLLPGFVPYVATLTVDAFHKIGFDLDTIGREREIAYLEERTRLEYEKAGMRVNIAIWNMHVPIDGNHYFEQILESGLQPMGRGGGFRIVVFRGNGLIQNNGAGGYDNWRCSGKQTKDGNTVTFQPV